MHSLPSYKTSASSMETLATHNAALPASSRTPGAAARSSQRPNRSFDAPARSGLSDPLSDVQSDGGFSFVGDTLEMNDAYASQWLQSPTYPQRTYAPRSMVLPNPQRQQASAAAAGLSGPSPAGQQGAQQPSVQWSMQGATPLWAPTPNEMTQENERYTRLHLALAQGDEEGVQAMARAIAAEREREERKQRDCCTVCCDCLCA